MVTRLLGLLLFGVCVSLSGQDMTVMEQVGTYRDTLTVPNVTAVQSLQVETLASIQNLKSSFDSLKAFSGGSISKFQNVIDSLKRIGSPTSSLLSRMDSVVQWKDKQMELLRSKVDSVKAKFKERIKVMNIPEPALVTDKFDKLTAQMNIDVPGVVPAQIPSIDTNLSSLMDPLKQGTSLAKVEKLNLNKIATPGESLEDKVSQEVKSLSAKSMDRANDVIKLDDVQQEIGKAGEVNQKLGHLSDEDAAREMIMNDFKQEAVNHFAGKEAKIDAAVEQLAKFKKKFENAPDVSKLPKRPPNPMRQRSFGQRLVPGISFQVSRNSGWMIDFSPYLGYRFDGRLVGGAGWNHRIVYSRPSGGLSSQLSIFGPRVYGECMIRNGFSVRLEAEFMKAVVPTQFSSGRTDENGREWVFGTLVGIKKSYRLVKRVNGTAMMLYNVYNPDHRSPYQERLVVRIGIEINERNKKKKV